ncbi:hypothetical protein D3C86_1342350 [compost metagenome]
MVAARWIVLFAMNERGRATFTGRLAARAPSAARMASDRTQSFAPNPPPMNGESRRTFSAGILSVLATSSLLQAMNWLDVQSVNLSPFHEAMDACGSIIACVWSGVV